MQTFLLVFFLQRMAKCIFVTDVFNWFVVRCTFQSFKTLPSGWGQQQPWEQQLTTEKINFENLFYKTKDQYLHLGSFQSSSHSPCISWLSICSFCQSQIYDIALLQIGRFWKLWVNHWAPTKRITIPFIFFSKLCFLVDDSILTVNWLSKLNSLFSSGDLNSWG